MKNTSIQQHNELNEPINHRLQQIESIIDDLLYEVPLENLTATQRLTYATRLLSQHIRMLALKHTVQLAQHSSTDEEALLTQLQQLILESMQSHLLTDDSRASSDVEA